MWLGTGQSDAILRSITGLEGCGGAWGKVTDGGGGGGGEHLSLRCLSVTRANYPVTVVTCDEGGGQGLGGGKT